MLPKTYLDPAGSSAGGRRDLSHRRGIASCGQLCRSHWWRGLAHGALRKVHTQHRGGLLDADDA